MPPPRTLMPVLPSPTVFTPGSAITTRKIEKLAHSSWTVAVYNLLGRRNPYSVYFQTVNGQIKGYKLSIFGEPIPTVTYNFRF